MVLGWFVGLVYGGFEMVFDGVEDVLSVFCDGFGMFLYCFGMFLFSRSSVAEKVEEAEPMRARERTTGRAVWVGLGVFLAGLLDWL